MYFLSLSLGIQQVPQAPSPLPPCPLVSLGPEPAVASPLGSEPAGRTGSAPWPRDMGGSRPQLAAGSTAPVPNGFITNNNVVLAAILFTGWWPEGLPGT